MRTGEALVLCPSPLTASPRYDVPKTRFSLRLDPSGHALAGTDFGIPRDTCRHHGLPTRRRLVSPGNV